MFAIHNSQETLAACLKLARGCYQSAILRGHEALSGSTLRGKAKQYAGRYCRSAQAVLARCRAAGLPIREERGAHGKRLVVIG